MEEQDVSIDRELTSGTIIPMQVIHTPSDTKGRIIINYPGSQGDINGYNDKYRQLAFHMAQRIGPVLRISGPDILDVRANHFDDDYRAGVSRKLEAVVRFAIENALTLAKVSADELSIDLVGFSAGASGSAALASKFPQIKRTLLMAPSGDAGEGECREGLGKFEGEVYAIVGDNDEVVGPKVGNIFAGMATRAKTVKNLTISNCDHQFRGEFNGRIMSAAPIWAFLKNGEGEIDPSDGIVLYR